MLTENLRRGVGIVMGAVSSRSTLPILSGILIKAENEGLMLMATDLEISFRVKVGAKVKKEGEMVVPAKLLFDLVSSLPVGPMEMKIDKQTLMIDGGGVKAEIIGQAAEEFPSLPESSGKVMKLSVNNFREKIDRVSVSASRDDTRPVLSGVLWSFDKEKIDLVATDGYRLGVDVLEGVKVESKMEEKKLILPARSLQELSRVLADGQIRELGVEFDEVNQQVVFVAESVEMVSRLIAGEFPPYKQIMPSVSKVSALVGREELLEAVKRASLFARDGANIVRVNILSDKVEVKAESGQVGGSLSLIEAEVDGEEVEMAFNARYLLDYLGVVGAEKVAIEAEGELKPGVFKVKDNSFVQIVMPIRLQNN